MSDVEILLPRKFEPVELPEELVGFERVAQTFLRHENNCPRSGYLYLLTNGGAATWELERGSAIHEIAERGTRAILESGGTYFDDRGREVVEIVPPEVVKDIANEVLAEQHVPFEEHDYVRECAYRWASDMAPRIDPREVVSCETLFVWEIAGFTVRAKIDLALTKDNGAAIEVYDYKSSRHLPSYEEISRKRPFEDDSYAAKNYQLILYALIAAFGVPVRVEDHLGERVEILEPFPVADRAQEFRLHFAYPGIESKDGTMAMRDVTLTRLELYEYRESFIGQLQRIAEAQQTGNWPAVTGSHCSECPAQMLCPIPAELRDYAGTINTPEQAAEALEVHQRTQAIQEARMKEIKAFVKGQPGKNVRFGRDQVAEFVYTESDKISDKDGMFDAVERAVRYGQSFERSKFVKTSGSTRFGIRQLKPEELEDPES